MQKNVLCGLELLVYMLEPAKELISLCSNYRVTLYYFSSFTPVVMGDPSEVDKHLAEGKRLLQEGQLSDALYHYAAAVGE